MSTKQQSGFIREHQPVHGRVEELVAELSKAGAPARLRRVLDELSCWLPIHLADEESPDGLHAELVRRWPPCAREVADLQVEHRELLAMVAVIESHLRDDPVHEGLVYANVARLIGKLSRHEGAEARLIFATMQTDTGTGD